MLGASIRLKVSSSSVLEARAFTGPTTLASLLTNDSGNQLMTGSGNITTQFTSSAKVKGTAAARAAVGGDHRETINEGG